MLLAGDCADVCIVASVRRVLLAAPWVVSLCAVGIFHVSTILILSSLLSSSSLLLLFAVGPLFAKFCVVGSCVTAFTRFFPCRFFVIDSSSKDNMVALAISASSSSLRVVVGGGFCLDGFAGLDCCFAFPFSLGRVCHFPPQIMLSRDSSCPIVFCASVSAS